MGPRPAPPVTVQAIEDAKERFLGYREQTQELIASGDNPDLLMGIIDSMAWKRRELEGYGVDIAELIASDAGSVSPVSNGSGASAVVSPSVLKPAGVQGDSLVGVSVPAGIPESKRKTLSPREVSEIMGIAYKTVLQHLESGQIPHGIKVGNRWVVQQEQFEQWFKGKHREEEKPVVPPVRERFDRRNTPRKPGDFRPSF
jgi:excisionase family DNA binding protein